MTRRPGERTVIAQVVPGEGDTELITVAAVKIRATREQVVGYYGQMITYVDGQVTTAFGRFSTPPCLADVKDSRSTPTTSRSSSRASPVTATSESVGPASTKIRAAVNWTAPDAAESGECARAPGDSSTMSARTRRTATPRS